MKDREIKINPIGYVRVVEKNPNEIELFLLQLAEKKLISDNMKEFIKNNIINGDD